MSAPAGSYCPGCGEHAALVLPGQTQAFCGNDDCRVFSWEMTKTPEELMGEIHVMDPLPGPPPSVMVFQGPAAIVAADLIKACVAYLLGPGYDGFLAWLDQGNHGPCSGCGATHGPKAEAVRGNLEGLKAVVENAVANPEAGAR